MHTQETEKCTEQVSVEAVVENLDRVTGFVNECLERHDCPMKVQIAIDIAIDELFGNIAHYAYSPKIGPVTVRVEVVGRPDEGAAEKTRTATITFIDGGTPFDPLSWPQPDITLSAAERKIGGLGIYLVKKSMDEVSYEYKEGQNVLRIKKHF